MDPDWGDKVNSGIGLSHWPARLHGLAGRYDNPMPELDFIPRHGSMNSAALVVLNKLVTTFEKKSNLKFGLIQTRKLY